MHFSFIAKYQIDNTPCIVAVSVDITERKKNRRALKGNECAAYFENDDSNVRQNYHLPIPNFSKRTKKKKACTD
jgi:hypothetical protein